MEVVSLPNFFSELLDVIIPSRASARKLSAENRRLAGFLRSVPVEYCGWNSSGVQAISENFINLFGLKKIETLIDIQEALSPDDAAALDGMYAHLAEYGKSFHMEVSSIANKNRILKIVGKRGQLSGVPKEDIFDVLWVSDISLESGVMDNVSSMLEKTEHQEKKWRNILNALPFPVWLRNDDIDITWCNKKYTQILDSTAATVVSEQYELPTTSLNKNNYKDNKGSRVLAQRVLGTGASQKESRHLVIGGERRLVEIEETLVERLEKKFIVGCAYDITNLENVEDQLKHHLSTYREVLEHLRTSIAVFDADARLEFYNASYEQLWGFDGKWLDTRPKITEILEKRRVNRKLSEQADFKKFRQNWLNMFSSLLEPHEEMEYLPDGTALRMVAVPRPMGGIILTYEDVTSRLELETSYNTLLAVQKETLDNLNEGLAVFGEDGCVKLWNPRFLEIWQLAPEYLERMPHITELVEKFSNNFEKKKWQKIKETLVKNGLERKARRDRMVCNDGRVLESTVIPLPDGNIFNGYFDVTDEAHVENALREKNAALEETERLKLDFLANVSYQLRTPLNAIAGFAEMLDQEYFGKINEKQKEYTQGMVTACGRLSNLIDDILDLSTIEAGYMELNFEPVNVCTVINDVKGLAEEWGRKHNIYITTKCTKSIGSVVADEIRMKQVLMKLISNAINFSPDGGKIDIIAKKDKVAGSIIIIVQDTGVGIGKEDLEKIFTPFEKTSFSKKRNAGAGLGLSIVKHIMDLHKGDVSIESKLGSGTKVSCSFPMEAV